MRIFAQILLALQLAAQPARPQLLTVSVGTGGPSGGGGSTATFDATASGGANSSPVSFSITIGSGSNRGIGIGCSFSSNAVTSIAVTVGGTSATLVPNTTSSGESYLTVMHSLAAPGTGSQTVSISWTGASSTYCGAVSVTGVDQAMVMQNGTFAHAGSGGTASVTITSAANDLTFSVLSAESGATPTAPNQTSRWAAAQNFTTGSGGETAAGAATVTHTWATGSGWLMSGADFKHA